MKTREFKALKSAYETPDGWGLFSAKTTMLLAKRGYFAEAQHPRFGKQWRLTSAGREAFEKANSARDQIAGRPRRG